MIYSLILLFSSKIKRYPLEFLYSVLSLKIKEKSLGLYLGSVSISVLEKTAVKFRYSGNKTIVGSISGLIFLLRLYLIFSRDTLLSLISLLKTRVA
jgi:hypothetical protein